MSERLYPYYETELSFIRQMAAEFAQRYPKVADRLRLEEGTSVDPHVERLIQAFALISARIHCKLDDEFPELTEALLGVLYPHYLAPVPSMTTVQFEADPASAQSPKGHVLPRQSRLGVRIEGRGRCHYRTGYELRLWPLRVASASLQSPAFDPPIPDEWQPEQTKAAIRLRLESRIELPMHQWELDRLRFFLSGDKPVVAGLYDLIFNHTLRVVYRDLDQPLETSWFALAPEEAIRPVGFEPDEMLLPYPEQSFRGYGLLSEFFAFPEKFHYFELSGLDRLRSRGVARRFEVIFFLNRLPRQRESAVDAATFKLGCTPVINLFDAKTRFIELVPMKYEYLLTAEDRDESETEIYSVNRVSVYEEKEKEFAPFYDFRHGRDSEQQRALWHAVRRPSPRKDDDGTDVYLSLVDLDFNPRLPAASKLEAAVTCTNRDMPQILRKGPPPPLELEDYAGLPLTVRCLHAPTAPLRPPLRRGQHWRLLSHLNLNYLSLTREHGRDALREILRLYEFSGAAGKQLAAVNRMLIDGIAAVSHRPAIGRVGGPVSGGFARGVEVTIEFKEENYAGTSVVLFASVLERFLGLYVSLNSFVQLAAKLTTSADVLKRWPPRSGEQAML